jgi:hypothetical protein
MPGWFGNSVTVSKCASVESEQVYLYTAHLNGWFQASVFWVITLREVVWNRRFGTTYRPHLQGSSFFLESLTLEIGTDRFFRNVYNYKLRCIALEKRKDLKFECNWKEIIVDFWRTVSNNFSEDCEENYVTPFRESNQSWSYEILSRWQLQLFGHG